MKKVFVAIGLMLLFVACPQSNVGISKARVLSSISNPNLETCPIIRTQYIAIKGENFGVAADWANGTNKVIFFDNVVVPSADVELTQAGNPATLFVKVPSAAQSGPLVVEVAGVTSAPINVIITDFVPSNAVGECIYPAN